MTILLQPTSFSVIIPAAGNGSRFESVIPKQYAKIGAKTVIEYTLQKWFEIDEIQEIIVVLSSKDSLFKQLPCANHPKLKTTIGGETRADSVLAGLNQQTSAWAFVHDAARPCITKKEILKLMQVCLENPIAKQTGAILAYRLTDTIKKEKDNSKQIAKTIDREQLWGALTPQLFPAYRLKEALAKGIKAHQKITDEASALELQGILPCLVEGSKENIKITHPADLALAAYYLTEQKYFIEEKE